MINLEQAEELDLTDQGPPNSGTPLVTSWGRKCRLVAYTAPKPGDLYLKPSGKRKIRNILSCKQEGHKIPRLILVTTGWVGGRNPFESNQKEHPEG